MNDRYISGSKISQFVALQMLAIPVLSLWICLSRWKTAGSWIWLIPAAAALLSAALFALWAMRIPKNSSVKAWTILTIIMLESALPLFLRDPGCAILLLLPGVMSGYFQSKQITLTWFCISTLAFVSVLAIQPSGPSTAGASASSILAALIFAGAAACVILHNYHISHGYQILSRIHGKDQQLGIYTKDAFQTHMRRILAENPDKKYYLIVTNILHFRVFNDYFGHNAGDHLLKTSAELLAKYAGNRGIVGRFADDHIICLIEQEAFSEDAFRHEYLKNEKLSGSKHYTVQSNCGIYEIYDSRIAADVMCDRAFIACRSGQAASSEITYYRESMLNEARRKREILGELNIALEQHQFIPYFQPQCTADGKLIGAEVLCRWNHPERGIVPPTIFIPLCEEYRLISKLDREMWEIACKTMRSWLDQGIAPAYLSVNISPIDILELDVLGEIVSLTEKYDLAHELIHLEITETTAMRNAHHMTRIISDMHRLGFIVELDDFGSGYSSLGVISELNIDVIKLDMSFLQHLDESRNGANVLKLIAGLVSSLGIQAIVEGVERADHLDLLMQMGYTSFQGMLFSAPISTEEFETKYLQH